MKFIFVYIIKLYQLIISPVVKSMLGIKGSCRYEVTCSEYARISILNDGIIKGSFKSILRILSCQPYFKIPKPNF